MTVWRENHHQNREVRIRPYATPHSTPRTTTSGHDHLTYLSPGQATLPNIAAFLPAGVAGSVVLRPHLRYVLGGEPKKAAAFVIRFLPS
jgi:hypothetical protein